MGDMIPRGAALTQENNMHDTEHFRQSYQSTEAPPWDIGKPDHNLIQIVTTTPVPPCKALDLGCGTGDNAIWLAQQGFDVVAIDVSSIAIERARHKAAQAGVHCAFVEQDVLERDVKGAPFHFAFDRGFLHIFDSEEQRRNIAETMSRYLDAEGLWLSLLGNADEVRRGGGPPQRTARDIVTAVERYFEILSLASSHFEGNLATPPRAWACLMKKRAPTS